MPHLNVFILPAAQWRKTVLSLLLHGQFYLAEDSKKCSFLSDYKLSLPLLPMLKADFRLHLVMPPRAWPLGISMLWPHRDQPGWCGEVPTTCRLDISRCLRTFLRVQD